MITILPFLLSLFVYGQYGGNHFEFDIELANGDIRHGYQYIGGGFSVSDDSVKSLFRSKPEYLLRNDRKDEFGELSYYEKRIEYSYPSQYHGLNLMAYILTSKVGIHGAEIKSLDQIKMFPYPGSTWVENAHRAEDEVWMQSEVITQRFFNGTLCSYEVFFHDKNTRLDLILKELDYHINAVNKLWEEINTTRDNHDEIWDLIHDITTKVGELVKEFDQEKVVVVADCTC
ncbi:MAG: hypothetical protein WBG42_05085 [Cryomorphaceae bacterium]